MVCLLAGVAPAFAQGEPNVEPNLAGKTVRVVIGSAPGGTYDLLGRAVARHIGRYLPGQPPWCRRTCPARAD